jgi:hypothetical protein
MGLIIPVPVCDGARDRLKAPPTGFHVLTLDGIGEAAII